MSSHLLTKGIIVKTYKSIILCLFCVGVKIGHPLSVMSIDTVRMYLREIGWEVADGCIRLRIGTSGGLL
jgi:hypothetical protein